MAELEREKSGRTSEPQPWNRLAARIFDYAIWGLVLAIVLSELRGAGVLSSGTAYWLGYPLIAPIIITASWVPVEALLIAALGTTPGKWLFGVYLQFSISDAYALRDAKSQIQRGFRRAFRVWWSGMGCGIVPLAAVLIAYAYEKVAREQETEWDFAEDCLVAHGRERQRKDRRGTKPHRHRLDDEGRRSPDRSRQYRYRHTRHRERRPGRDGIDGGASREGQRLQDRRSADARRGQLAPRRR